MEYILYDKIAISYSKTLNGTVITRLLYELIKLHNYFRLDFKLYKVIFNGVLKAQNAIYNVYR